MTFLFLIIFAINLLKKFGLEKKKSLNLERKKMDEFREAYKVFDVKRVKQLIDEEGFDVNQKNAFGETPLMRVVYYSQECAPIVKVLIDSGADVKHVYASGFTIFMYAAEIVDSYRTMSILFGCGC